MFIKDLFLLLTCKWFHPEVFNLEILQQNTFESTLKILFFEFQTSKHSASSDILEIFSMTWTGWFLKLHVGSYGRSIGPRWIWHQFENKCECKIGP